MLDFSVVSFSEYKSPEKGKQTVEAYWLTFQVSGLLKRKMFEPKGRTLWEPDVALDKPYFSFLMPGTYIEFEYGQGRSNWVVMFDHFPLRYSSEQRRIEFNISGNSWITLPLYTFIPPENLDAWRLEFEKLQIAYNNPTPFNIMRVKLGIMNVLRYVIEQIPEQSGNSPEENLKRMLDKDKSCRHDLKELSKNCGLSVNRMRQLFWARYKINPNEYRERKRNAFIMDMITNSKLSLKEIAEYAGFKHFSHLSAVMKKNFGLNPREALRQFRYKLK